MEIIQIIFKCICVNSVNIQFNDLILSSLNSRILTGKSTESSYIVQYYKKRERILKEINKFSYFDY